MYVFMSNVVFVIVDSLSYDRITYYNQKEPLTPFLNSIKNNCFYAENMFSSGPYTEAGTKGLLCSCDTLDNGGYFYRYESQDKFITDIFKDMGFDVYNINAPSYLLSKRTINNIDHMIYTSGIDFRFLWSQRFDFYYDSWKKGYFNENDYKYLSKFVKLVFESAEDFFDGNRTEKFMLIQNFVDDDIIEENKQILFNQKQLFERDSKKFIDSIFEKKMKHPIFSIKNIRLSDMIDTKSVNKAFDNHKTLIKKIKKIQFNYNLKNNHCNKNVLFRTIKDVIKDKKISKNNCGELINKFRNLFSGRELNVYRKGLYYTKDPYKLIPSSKTQMEFAASLINNSVSNNNFVFIHTEEPHYFNTFFSYDSKDEKLLNEELDIAEKFVDSIDSNYSGSIYYDLSVRYVDDQLKKLYQSLEKSGKIDETLIVITADHGSSYYFSPIRKRLVNNFYSENYHVPLFILGNGVKKEQYDYLCMSKDVIPTIMEFLKKQTSSDLKGSSLISAKTKDKILIEYMGPGCPDIRLKPVWLSARSKNYSVSYVGQLSKDFNENEIQEIYDLKSDRLELNNIKDFRNEEIFSLIEIIKNRFLILKRENIKIY